jgi:phosphoribosyl 1,2-cyclic phosphodiesterase
MKLTFLGSGSAFTYTNRQSNLLFESDSGKKLLLDCGTDIRHSLSLLNYSHLDVNSVYISHAHADHAGGLEWLAFSTYFDPRTGRPDLFLSADLSQTIWENTMSGGARSLQGSIAKLDTYFNIHPIVRNGCFIWENINFQLVQTVHIVDAFSFSPSYGLMFIINDKRYFFTSDTQHAPNQLKDFYKMSDVIFNDCETSKFKSGVHAHYTELKELDSSVKGKMWLYHYNDGDLPDAEADGFRGFVKQGQVFEF